jgi:filamentous hemagglutinin
MVTPENLPGNVIAAAGGDKNRLPIPDVTKGDNGLQVESNPKHTPGMGGNRPNAGTEPKNSLDLFNSSVAGGDRVRYAIDSNGNINRFSTDGNGVYHWSGSTGDPSAPMNASNIPIEVRRSLGFKGK